MKKSGKVKQQGRRKNQGGQIAFVDLGSLMEDQQQDGVGRRQTKIITQHSRQFSKGGHKSKRGRRESFVGIKSLLQGYQPDDKGGYITQEFQDYGYRLAMELADEKHKALYIKLAKSEDRRLLEKTLSFVKDAGAKKPGALFMWKFKQLKSEENGGEKCKHTDP